MSEVERRACQPTARGRSKVGLGKHLAYQIDEKAGKPGGVLSVLVGREEGTRVAALDFAEVAGFGLGVEDRGHLAYSGDVSHEGTKVILDEGGGASQIAACSEDTDSHEAVLLSFKHIPPASAAS